MNFKKLAAVACLAVGFAGSASAIPVYTFMPDAPGGGNDFAGDIATFFGGAGNVGFGYVVDVTGDGARHSFYNYGAESGFTNTFSGPSGSSAPASITENDESFGGVGCVIGTNCSLVAFLANGSLAPDALKFTTTGSGGVDAQIGDKGFGIYYDKSGASDYVFLAYDDDGAGPDDNHDDFLIKTYGRAVSVVPLPAAGWLLLAGVGGLAAMRRRKKS